MKTSIYKNTIEITINSNNENYKQDILSFLQIVEETTNTGVFKHDKTYNVEIVSFNFGGDLITMSGKIVMKINND
jgi:hypothetical protein